MGLRLTGGTVGEGEKGRGGNVEFQHLLLSNLTTEWNVFYGPQCSNTGSSIYIPGSKRGREFASPRSSKLDLNLGPSAIPYEIPVITAKAYLMRICKIS